MAVSCRVPTIWDSGLLQNKSPVAIQTKKTHYINQAAFALKNICLLLPPESRDSDTCPASDFLPYQNALTSPGTCQPSCIIPVGLDLGLTINIRHAVASPESNGRQLPTPSPCFSPGSLPASRQRCRGRQRGQSRGCNFWGLWHFHPRLHPDFQTCKRNCLLLSYTKLCHM